MDKKILIYTDNHKRATFEKAVNETIEGCNSLIEIYHTFIEPFDRVASREEAEILIRDPEGTFDNALIANVNLSAGHGIKPDPKTAAQLFNIDRPNYLNLVAGFPIVWDDCKPCQKAKIKKGQRAISFERYRTYSPFMRFDGGEFVANPEAIEDKLKSFDVYAVTEEQTAVYNHYTDLITILNCHLEKYPLPDRTKEAIAKGLNLQLSQGVSGTFVMDKQYISHLIASK
jgi:hypothetical protein